MKRAVKGHAMLRRIGLKTLGISLVLPCLQLISCCLIGYGIGSMTEGSPSREEIYSRASTDTTLPLSHLHR